MSVSDELLALKTTYEKRHLEAGRTIKYLCFGFSKNQLDINKYSDTVRGRRIADDVDIGPLRDPK